MATEGASVMPRLDERGIEALRRTRPWALFTGIMAFIFAAYSLFNASVYMFFRPHFPLGTSSQQLPPEVVAAVVKLLFVAGIVTGIVGLCVNCLFGWFAIQYGRSIKSSLERGSAEGLESAMWWQRRYWTLQGVMLIVGIVVAILAFIGIVAMGVIVGAQHGGMGT